MGDQTASSCMLVSSCVIIINEPRRISLRHVNNPQRERREGENLFELLKMMKKRLRDVQSIEFPHMLHVIRFRNWRQKKNCEADFDKHTSIGCAKSTNDHCRTISRISPLVEVDSFYSLFVRSLPSSTRAREEGQKVCLQSFAFYTLFFHFFLHLHDHTPKVCMRPNITLTKKRQVEGRKKHFMLVQSEWIESWTLFVAFSFSSALNSSLQLSIDV